MNQTFGEREELPKEPKPSIQSQTKSKGGYAKMANMNQDEIPWDIVYNALKNKTFKFFGRLVFFAACGGFLISFATGKTFRFNAVWDFFNPAILFSIPGSAAGNGVRGINDGMIEPMNEQLRTSENGEVTFQLSSPNPNAGTVQQPQSIDQNALAEACQSGDQVACSQLQQQTPTQFRPQQ